MSAAASPAPLTGLVYDPLFLEHRTGPRHPESPERLETVMGGLEEAGLVARLAPVAARPAERRTLEAVHDRGYLEELEAACLRGRKFLHCPETWLSRDSARAACLAAGGAAAAVDAVVEGEVANAFCALRPPGHHAGRREARGFCLLNNVAVAAGRFREKHGPGRVFIFDWDVHHGNGTQEIFEEDPGVFYCSIHRYPHYPGTGCREERGEGAGRGFTANLPLPAGSGDAEYLAACREEVLPALKSFRPDIILLSSGFDACAGDPLGVMGLTVAGVYRLTALLRAAAGETCGGRLVSVLEGGYDLASLGAAAAAHVAALAGLGMPGGTSD